MQEGIEYDFELSGAPPVMRHDCIEIFPLGGFIYITDDVFDRKPQLALEIVKAFVAKIERLRSHNGPTSPWQELHDVPLLWRLCARPELMDHIFRRCEEQGDKLETGDADVGALASLYTLLSETNYIEQDSPVQPFSAVSDNYPIMSERRVVADEQPLNYFNTLARSQEEANLRMIQYYSTLQIDMRRDYRHFFVVHTEPSAAYVKDWKQEMQNIAEVITPEQCVAELARSSRYGGKETMFDFCERYMPKQPAIGAHLEQTTKDQSKSANPQSPQVTNSQMSLEEGEIRASQQSL